MLRPHPAPVFLAAREKSDCLAILLHGCAWRPGEGKGQLAEVADAVRESLPNADILMPQLPIEFWSLHDPDDVVSSVIDAVDRVWTRRADAQDAYRTVILIGFSFGSVLLRQVYCRAAGAQANATLDRASARPWAGCIERMILIAGLNRGWTVDSPVTRLESFLNNIGTAIGHLLPRKPTLFAIRRGAPFLTRTRLQWLALERAGMTPPITVQLLGTRDDIVSPVDNIDLATGNQFVYLEVPESGHFDVIHMAADSQVGRTRRRIFQRALTRTLDELREEGISDDELAQLLPVGGDPAAELALRMSGARTIDDVVFVLHGIRDKGYWTRKVARMVVSHGRKRGRNVVAVAPTYGYFAMLPFLLPWTRRAKVEWLLDIYVAVRCWHPDADVSFVGHSNGTYIAAAAIEACPSVHFKNLVFAGSVVRSNFDWQRYVETKQVRGVVNYVAAADWVVAVFPKVFQMLRLQDLGSAGHDGFTNGRANGVTDVEYVPGHHSAALDEKHWPDIARYVIDGTPPGPRVAVRSSWVAAAGYATPLIWCVLAAFAFVPTYFLLIALGVPEVSGWCWIETWRQKALAQFPAWLWAGALAAWMQMLGLFLTRL